MDLAQDGLLRQVVRISTRTGGSLITYRFPATSNVEGKVKKRGSEPLDTTGFSVLEGPLARGEKKKRKKRKKKEEEEETTGNKLPIATERILGIGPISWGWGSRLIDLVFCGALVAIGHDAFDQLERVWKTSASPYVGFLVPEHLCRRVSLPCLGSQTTSKQQI